MFRLSYKTIAKPKYDSLSVAIIYMQDDRNLSNSIASVEKKFRIKLSELQKKNLSTKKFKQLIVSNNKIKPEQFIINKFKLDEKFTVDYFRNHLAGLIKTLDNEQIKSLHLFIPDSNIFRNYFDDKKYFYRSFLEGLSLGNYIFDKYKKERSIPRNLNVFVYADDEKLLRSAFAKHNSLMDGVNYTKDLQNEPPSSLRPFELAESVKQNLSKYGMKVTVFDEKEIKKRNMGGLLAVGKGSNSKPRFVVIEYKPKNIKNRSG